MEGVFDQSGHRLRLEWGRRGTKMAAARGDVIVVVDALSFSTTAATAAHHGVVLHPVAKGRPSPELVAYARALEAQLAVERKDVPVAGKFSASPLGYVGAEQGTRVVLATLNGATCLACSQGARAVFVGAFVNASAVARVVDAMLAREEKLCATIVAAGERWPDDEGGEGMRVAIEDWLAAGSILLAASPKWSRSPEARLAEIAFGAAKQDLSVILLDSGSGRELAWDGWGDDVAHACKVDLYDVVPELVDGALARRSH